MTDAPKLLIDLRCSCGATCSLECPPPNTWERAHQMVEVVEKWIDAHRHSAPKPTEKP